MRAYGGWLFGAAAVFNAAVGLGLLFARPWLGGLIGLDPATGTNLALLYLTASFILLFAGAYGWVALKPMTNRPLILLGAIGKLVAVVCVAVPWMTGAIDARLPSLAAGDLVFAALFLDYLRRTRQRAR
jgi:hypothetical protein